MTNRNSVLKTNAFSTIAGRYYVCILFSHSFKQIMHFVSDTTLTCFAYNSNRKSKNYKVSIWSDLNTINLILFFHAKRRTMRSQDGLEHDVYTQSDWTGSGQFRLHLDSVKKVAANWAGQQ